MRSLSADLGSCDRASWSYPNSACSLYSGSALRLLLSRSPLPPLPLRECAVENEREESWLVSRWLGLGPGECCRGLDAPIDFNDGALALVAIDLNELE